MLLVRQRMVAN